MIFQTMRKHTTKINRTEKWLFARVADSVD
jgi:hypothetical protein